MVTTKLNLSMTEPSVRQIYAKQGDTGRVLDISLDQTPEDGTLRILRPDGVEVTSEAVTGGEVESGGTFESLTEADVTKLTVGIEPIQDLNGYDKPWVGGAGKNLLPMTLANLKAIQSANGSWSGNTYTLYGVSYAVGTDDGGNVISITVNGTATQYSLFYLVGAISFPLDVRLSGCASGGSYSGYRLQAEGGTTRQDIGNGVQIPANEEKTRVIIVVPPGESASSAVFKPMIRLSTETDATFAPYSNICPITGHDEVRVTRTGKNLLDTSTVTVSGITFTQDSGGRLSASPNNSDPRSWGYANSQYKVTLPKGSYTIVAEVDTVTSATSNALIVVNKDGTRLTNFVANPLGTVGIKTASFTLTEETPIGVMAKQYSTVYRLMIVASGESTAYEPYQGSTYTTSLGQTVYGGTLDMVSGVLTVTHGNIASYNGETLPSTWISDRDVYASGTTPTTGAQVVYELATPLTYTLTAHQIKTLVGTNNVWASSGDIVSIKFAYGGLFSELPSEATEIVGKCYCDVEQNGVSSMPFTLNVKKNERES